MPFLAPRVVRELRKVVRQHASNRVVVRVESAHEPFAAKSRVEAGVAFSVPDRDAWVLNNVHRVLVDHGVPSELDHAAGCVRVRAEAARNDAEKKNARALFRYFSRSAARGS